MTLPTNVLQLAARARDGRSTDGVVWREWGDGAPLVLFHGGAGSWTHWCRNIPALSTRFRVIALNLPGFGDSSRPEKNVSVDAYVGQAAAAVREASGDETVRLAGFSFGGFVATGVAAVFGRKAHSLAAIAPSGFAEPVGRKLNLRSLRGERQRLGRTLTDEELRSLHRNNLLAMMLANEKTVGDEALALQACNVEGAHFDTRPLSWSGRLFDFLGQLDCPLCLIYGTMDTTAFPSIGERVALVRAIVPDLEFETVEGAGHWVQYECADIFNDRLLRFIAQPGRVRNTPGRAEQESTGDSSL